MDGDCCLPAVVVTAFDRAAQAQLGIIRMLTYVKVYQRTQVSVAELLDRCVRRWFSSSGGSSQLEATAGSGCMAPDALWSAWTHARIY